MRHSIAKSETSQQLQWHGLTLFVVMVWGTTLASTKILLATMSPLQILLYRSIFAYLLLVALSGKLHLFGNAKNELLYGLAGLCGITLYFLFENTALLYTYTSNAALLVSASPLFTVLIACFVFKNHPFSKRLLLASVLALGGVAVVLTKQPINLTHGLWGNLLAILSGLVWSFFSFAMNAIKDQYSPIVRMRKVFFYGMVATVVYMLVVNAPILNLQVWMPLNFAHLAFLGAVASALCFVLWTHASEHLGVVTTSLYIYFVPLVAVLLGVFVLDEKLTGLTLAGGVMIVVAVCMVNANKNDGREM